LATSKEHVEVNINPLTATQAKVGRGRPIALKNYISVKHATRDTNHIKATTRKMTNVFNHFTSQQVPIGA